MKERPILFSTPMVKALLDGRKTMTRRVVKIPKVDIIEATFGYSAFTPKGHISFRAVHANGRYGESFIKCPYGTIGDVLWVRETYCDYNDGYGEEHKHLRADGPWYLYKASSPEFATAKIWRPSIFMPRAACRIRLRITDIRVERVQEIDQQHALLEGITPVRQMMLYGLEKEGRDKLYRQLFQSLWQEINGAESWDANPWVWVISFVKL